VKKKAEKTIMGHPVTIADYDPRWPLIYAKERSRILGAVGKTIVAIEHIGSTAVPGLGAKPIIDIIVALPRLSDAQNCIEPLKGIGYEYVPEYEALIPERRYFRKGPESIPDKHFHLHMVERNGDFWKRHLMFRDYLRSHPDMAQQYSRLKKELAEKHASNREAYTEAKTSFIESVIVQAQVTPRLHLRYIRLPAQVVEMYDDQVYNSKKIVVGKSQITSTHSIVFDGKLVLSAGFPIVYFELTGRWFNIVKIRNLQGTHTGYYCDITTPPRLLRDGSIELTDLFLDLWVSPDLRYKVLDKDELEEALEKGWVEKQLHDKAKKELKKLITLVENGGFPPKLVRRLEERLKL
jgi:GrpB-like predicted nucleotidyltransferase (UPF0157 family)/predicted RNA-binding protein associated with RNAse of E/G family